MGGLGAVIHRKACTCVLVVLVVVVDAHVAAHFRLRLQTRTLGTHVDHAVQRSRSVQNRRGALDHLHLRYVLQRHVVPVDLTRLGIEDRHLVHEHLTTRTHTVGPSATATYTRLLVNDLHAGQGLQGCRQVRRSLAAQHLRLDHLHRHRHICLTLLETAGCHNHVVQQLVMRQQVDIQLVRHRGHDEGLRIIAHIRKTQLNRFLGVQFN